MNKHLENWFRFLEKLDPRALENFRTYFSSFKNSVNARMFADFCSVAIGYQAQAALTNQRLA